MSSRGLLLRGSEPRHRERGPGRYLRHWALAEGPGDPAERACKWLLCDADLRLWLALGGHDIVAATSTSDRPKTSQVVARTFPPDVPLRTCSAEDLIVLKVFAARPKDWTDVEGVIMRQTDRIDWSYVREQLEPLLELKEQPELWDELVRRRKTLDD